MVTRIRCLLINYDGGTSTLLTHYIRRAGCLELTQATGLQAEAQPAAYPIADADLIFLHLTSPEESLREDLALRLQTHTGVVITSPFPKQQFTQLPVQPFAFLTEPFSFLQFTDCLNRYQQIYK